MEIDINEFNFTGWATRNDIQCSDGRIIRQDAFKHNDGEKVPLVWNHDHTDPYRVVGHAILENREEGVYAYGKFNDTELGKTAQVYVEHGDIDKLSIYANGLKQDGPNVMHGNIREVSLVLSGANPGAYIENVIAHGCEIDEEAVIFTGEKIAICHAEKEGHMAEETKKTESEGGEETIQDVFNTLSEKQKKVVYALIGQALEDAKSEAKHSEGGDEDMKENVFDQNIRSQSNTLSHSDMESILTSAKRLGSLKEGFNEFCETNKDVLAHSTDIEYAGNENTYGINNPDWLFPEVTNLNPTPEFIKRDMGWVSTVMNGTHHSPFSRIKSVFADITEDDARARGYIKGKLKKEEVFGMLKRSTTPTTVYKKQKMDRDDIIDITTMDVVAWIKSEMRMMLNEEIARAILVGDGRLNSSDDKINEQNIRPIWKDEDLFTIKSLVEVEADATKAKIAAAFIDQCLRAKKDYKGSGSPTCFMTEDLLTDCLLLKDGIGHRLYKTAGEVANAIGVSSIVTVPIMEGLQRTDAEGKTRNLQAIIVNLKDYNVGADKGGAVSMFEDFDIDYNQQKYLIETRCSGALIKPFSAIVLETMAD